MHCNHPCATLATTIAGNSNVELSTGNKNETNKRRGEKKGIKGGWDWNSVRSMMVVLMMTLTIRPPLKKKGPIPHIGNAWCFWITRKIFIITSLVHSSFFLSLFASLAFSRYLSIALSCSRPLSVYCSDRNFIGTQPIPQFPAEPFNHPNRWIAFVCLLFAANHSVPFRSDSQPRPIVSIRGNRVTEKAEFTSAANCWYGGCVDKGKRSFFSCTAIIKLSKDQFISSYFARGTNMFYIKVAVYFGFILNHL